MSNRIRKSKVGLKLINPSSCTVHQFFACMILVFVKKYSILQDTVENNTVYLNITCMALVCTARVMCK